MSREQHTEDRQGFDALRKASSIGSRLPFRSIIGANRASNLLERLAIGPVLGLLTILTLGFASNVNAQITCADLDGAVVYSQESIPQYLGFFGNEFASESIMNSFGTYGSQFSSLSVRNEFGNYGSPFSSYSANNDFAVSPPAIFRGSTFLAYLSTNSTQSPRVTLAAIDVNCTFFATAPISGNLPLPPTAVSATDGTFDDRVEMVWTSGSGAVAYNIYISETIDSPLEYLGQIFGTAANVTGLEPGVTYYFWVFSENASGESILGSYDTGYVSSGQQATVPNAPTLNSAAPLDSAAILSFTPNGDGGSPITSYSASCGAFSQGGSSSPITIEGLSNGVQYSCSVVAVNSVGSSAPSNALSVTPQAPATSLTINAGMNDAWVSNDAPFQGVFFSVYESIKLFFLSWFTFDTVIPDQDWDAVFGGIDQRWVTGAGFYSGNSVTINVELTRGGRFHSNSPLAEQVPNYGTITIVFNSCSEAILTYNFPSLGVSGQMTLSRVLNDNVAICEILGES